MKVMLVGGGGREHAILEKLRESPRIDTIYALPGNGGMSKHATCVPISATDIDGIAAFALEKDIAFAIVAPDDPLIQGACDRLRSVGVRCFGPSAAAAAIEGSKSFAKELMQKYGIPTASYKVFDQAANAYAYLSTIPYPTVVKADGPALGKGVFIAQTEGEAKSAVSALMEQGTLGQSGSRVVIEEFLTGNEVSVLTFTDGSTLIPMVSALDHKRAFDNDAGPNTGGMGALAPNPFYTETIAKECMEHIFLPTIRAMNAEGRKFKGCLYFGLMLTQNGPKVIEYNCRFGDPETQVVLPLLESDLFEIMLAVEDERLCDVSVRIKDCAACCVVMASQGYPKKYETGYEISIHSANLQKNVFVYHAGTKCKSGRIRTSGGRVLGVTAVGDTPREAQRAAYEAVTNIHFENAFYRHDIGERALKATEQ
jgi:phosphoribosylamine--glycine ligase